MEAHYKSNPWLELRSLESVPYPQQASLKEIADTAVELSTLSRLAPGDAVVKRWASWRLLRLCSVLFGDLAGHFMNYFFYDPSKQTELHQRVSWAWQVAGVVACVLTSIPPVQC